MNAASLQSRAHVPVAASTITVVGGGGTAGGITPAAGQSFTPATAAQAKQAGAAGPAVGADGAASADGAAAPADGMVDAQQALTTLMQQFKDELGEPIVTADGSVYMDQKLSGAGGKVTLTYVLVGKLDSTRKRIKVSPAILAMLKAKESSAASASAQKKLVKIDDQYVWQTFGQDENGKTIVTEMKAATEAELQAMQAKSAKDAATAKTQDRQDWQQKVGIVAQTAGLFGGVGQFAQMLARGPDANTGRPGATVMSGYYLALRLNGKAEGKLLPQWMQQGPAATALDWGTQIYGLLDTGRDIQIVRDFLRKTPQLEVNPNAMAQLIAKGADPAMAQALTQLGTDLRVSGDTGPLMRNVADAARNPSLAANAVLLDTKNSALQFADKGALKQAWAATDPMQNAGVNARMAIDDGMSKGFSTLGKLIQPVMLGVSALNVVSNFLNLKNIVEKKGATYLLDTQHGRNATMSLAVGTASLGMSLLPMAVRMTPGVGALLSAVSIGVNVLSGVQLLNSYGLFGEQGFLNNDAVRSAFLVPPLTPIGAFAFVMKARRKKAEAAAAKTEAAKSLLAERVAQQQEMAKIQLQSTGKIAGATTGQDGTIKVTTTIPTDIKVLEAQLSGTAIAAATAGAKTSGSSGGSSMTAEDRATIASQRQLMMTARGR